MSYYTILSNIPGATVSGLTCRSSTWVMEIMVKATYQTIHTFHTLLTNPTYHTYHIFIPGAAVSDSTCRDLTWVMERMVEATYQGIPCNKFYSCVSVSFALVLEGERGIYRLVVLKLLF